ncbi:hypothetical protein Hbal_2892 [Hirschia baltica ATCC 49814]|uniref:Uncharacterized protein n=1 Tax=Hirschia baltica (strain ATCC 49814 / DSM 5838 / IFAM 1418) TaxID=582402 RepID=C6XR32_HIRBI|nr:hypothetical protein Hbal_2892 [Hirschia baltica ATCC 49814]
MTGYEKSEDYGSKPPSKTWVMVSMIVMLLMGFGIFALIAN